MADYKHLEPVTSGKRIKTWHFAVAAALCVFLVVAAIACHHIIYVHRSKQRPEVHIDFNETWYMHREQWHAAPPRRREFLTLPVHNVIIAHSGTRPCKKKSACTAKLRAIQKMHSKLGYDDIGPNFLIGHKGWMYEGRGAAIKSNVNLREWEEDSITITFIGDYCRQKPDKFELNHVRSLLDNLVRKEVLSPTYQLYGACQLRPKTISPGSHLMKSLHLLPHFNSTNMHECISDIDNALYQNHTVYINFFDAL